MVSKCFLAGFCDHIGSICLFPHKAFMHFYKPVFFKVHEVRSQVSVCYLQHFLQVIKIYFLVHQQDAHYAKPYAAIEYFIKTYDRILQCIRIILTGSFIKKSIKNIPVLLPGIRQVARASFIFPPHDNAINNMKQTKTNSPKP